MAWGSGVHVFLYVQVAWIAQLVRDTNNKTIPANALSGIRNHIISVAYFFQDQRKPLGQYRGTCLQVFPSLEIYGILRIFYVGSSIYTYAVLFCLWYTTYILRRKQHIYVHISLLSMIITHYFFVYGILYSVPEFGNAESVLRVVNYTHTGIYIYIIIYSREYTEYHSLRKNVRERKLALCSTHENVPFLSEDSFAQCYLKQIF